MSRQARLAARTIDDHRMLDKGERVLAGLSGGADSTALALVLVELGHDVVLGHVDHCLRAGSGLDAAHCAHLAATLGVPFLAEKVTVDPATQAQARKARYLALARMAGLCGASKIATGHTLDDQAETVRMRLERGGFAMGIPAVRDNIVRPLLALRRSDTEQLCGAAGVIYLHDPSNDDPRFTRVRIRSMLAGATDREVRMLAAAGGLAAADARRAGRRVQQLLARWVRFDDLEARIDRDALRALAPGQARRLVREVAGRFGLDPNPRLVDDILAKAAAVTGARLDLGKGLSVWSERDEVIFGRWPAEVTLPEAPVALPGVTLVPGWGLQVTAEWVQGPPVYSSSRWEEVVDGARLGEAVRIRQWMPGDRFMPLGAGGSRKLQDLFVDSGVPRCRRSRVPVLEAGGRIAWVVGHRLDDRFKVTSRTAVPMKIRVSRSVAG